MNSISVLITRNVNKTFDCKHFISDFHTWINQTAALSSLITYTTDNRNFEGSSSVACPKGTSVVSTSYTVWFRPIGRFMDCRVIIKDVRGCVWHKGT